MKKLLAAFLLIIAAGVALAQGTGVNPPAGSIWTYLGATYGAGWVPNTQSAACLSIAAFGGVGDDVTDNTAAFNAAKASTSCITFPAGTFRFNSTLAYIFTESTKSLRICGQASDVTVLHFPGAVSRGIDIKLDGFGGSFHICNLTMTTGTTNVDTGIYVEQIKTWGALISGGYARSTITGVTFRSDEGYWEQGAGTPTTITHSWAQGIHTINTSMIDIDGVIFAGPTPPGAYAAESGTGGVGILIEGTSNTVLPVEYQITRTHITNCRIGIILGNHTEGFQISHLNIVGCFAGIVAGAGVDLDQFILTNSHLNNVYSIRFDVSIANTNIGHNAFIIPSNGVAIALAATNRQTLIQGNTFMGVTDVSPFGGTGIIVNPITIDAVSPVITGNSLWRMAVGIYLGANVHRAIIANNFMGTDVYIQNDSTSIYNMITGIQYQGALPMADITGAVNNGGGLVRVTVPSTTPWVNGQMVVTSHIGGVVEEIKVTGIKIVDATHIDLNSVLFSGTYTGGGSIAALP